MRDVTLEMYLVWGIESGIAGYFEPCMDHGLCMFLYEGLQGFKTSTIISTLTFQIVIIDVLLCTSTVHSFLSSPFGDWI